RIGELCHLVDPETGRRVMAEVIGLHDEVAILTPIGDLFGLSSVTEVIPTGSELLAPVGEGLLGRVINALGDPIDGEPRPKCIDTRPTRATSSRRASRPARSPACRRRRSAGVSFRIPFSSASVPSTVLSPAHADSAS